MTRSHTHGFTLIELLMVVAMVGILGVVTVPAVAEGIRQFRLNSAGQQVASTIRTARYQAVGRNVGLRVKFNFPEDGQYQVVDLMDDPIGNVKILPEGTAFGDVSGDIEINVRGRVTPLAGALPVTIEVAHASDVDADIDGDAQTISVAGSGRVQLQ